MRILLNKTYSEQALAKYTSANKIQNGKALTAVGEACKYFD